MSKLEEQAVRLVKELLPDFQKLEFKATIGDSSHSIEFFVWVNHNRYQCYELVENGNIDEIKMESLFDAYADSFRSSDEYKKGEVNRVHFIIET